MDYSAIDYLQLPMTFDPTRLLEDLRKIGDSEWIDHFNKRDYEGDWSVAPLRQPSTAVHPIQAILSSPSVTEYVDGPLLDRCSYFSEVLGSFECQINSARLMRLHAGSVIKEHRDRDLVFEDGYARIHIPITTNPDVAFCLKGERVEMKEGETWYLNFSQPHSVTNLGSTDRIHLVIDCTVNNWMKEQFKAKGEGTVANSDGT